MSSRSGNRNISPLASTLPTQAEVPVHLQEDADDAREAALRLRTLFLVGGVVWPSFGVLDWFVTVGQPTSIRVAVLGIRAAGTLLLLVASSVLAAPRVERRVRVAVDVITSTFLAAGLAIAGIAVDGIATDYALGVFLVLAGRASVAQEHYRAGILQAIPPVLPLPLFALGASLFVPSIREELTNLHTLVPFLAHVGGILCVGAFTVVGGHRAWSLRRVLYQTRNLGRYELCERVGEGGMGEVWRARDRMLRRDVALKFLKREAMSSIGALERFAREVRAAAAISHPNAVQVLDHGVTAEGLPFYAMELLDGLNLEQLVDRDGPLEEGRARRLLEQIADALRVAHEHGIVHRDVKPENIIVTVGKDGAEKARLFDFGIAKIVVEGTAGDLTRTGAAIGTLAYMAPEALDPKSVDARADVFCLGGVGYFLLAGKAPWTGVEAARLVRGPATEAPPIGTSRGKPVSEAFEGLVRRCLSWDREARFSGMTPLLATLRSLPRGLGDPAGSERSS